jgi:hypothetical protein
MTSTPSDVVKTYQTICNDGTKSPAQKAAALAALYAPNAVAVFPEGIFTTNSEIQTDLSNQFTAGWSNIKLVDQNDIKENNVAWSYGNYSGNLGTQTISGYWSVAWVQDHNNNWLIQLHTTNQALTNQA